MLSQLLAQRCSGIEPDQGRNHRHGQVWGESGGSDFADEGNGGVGNCRHQRVQCPVCLYFKRRWRGGDSHSGNG